MTPITNRLPGFGAAEAARKRSSLLIKVAVTLVLLVVSLRWVRLDVLAASLRQARPGPLLVAALMLVLGGFAGAASWFCILRARLPSMRFRDAAACHWSGMFFNSFLPSNVGGDVVKGYLVMRNGAPAPSGETSTAPTWRVVVMSLLLDRALNLAMLLGIGGFALLIDRHGGGMAVTAAGAVLVALPLVSMAARRCACPRTMCLKGRTRPAGGMLCAHCSARPARSRVRASSGAAAVGGTRLTGAQDLSNPSSSAHSALRFRRSPCGW